MKSSGELKLDPGTRAGLAVLRALGRIKEHRSAGIVRFIVL